MRTYFADTFCYLAMLNPDDAAHQKVVATYSQLAGRTVTTAWVLTEVADALAAPAQRSVFLTFFDDLQTNPRVTIVPPDAGIFRRGIEFYRQRRDKEWSLTDCISFVVMREQGIVEALTGDHHFEQAGFRILLK